MRKTTLKFIVFWILYLLAFVILFVSAFVFTRIDPSYHLTWAGILVSALLWLVDIFLSQPTL